MVKQSYMVFNDFLTKDSSTTATSIPNFVPGSIVSVIRNIATNHSDPDCFVRFNDFQKRIGCKTSMQIEIIRFLALFPTRRANLLDELAQLKTKSNFNAYTIYQFQKILKGLKIEDTLKYQENVNDMYRKYIIHSHFYWACRSKNKSFRACIEAMSIQYYYIETYSEMKALLRRFPFDDLIHFNFGSFLIAACGDFDNSRIEMAISKGLKQTHTVMSDPLLHPMAILNPRILQYCTTDEAKTGSFNRAQTMMSTYNTNYTTNTSMSHSIVLSSGNQTQRNGISVASFLTISRRFVPSIFVFHYIIVFMIFASFLGVSYSNSMFEMETYKRIENQMSPTLQAFYNAVSVMFIPYALDYDEIAADNQTMINEDNTDECQQKFHQIPQYLVNFYANIPQIESLSGIMIVITYHHIHQELQKVEDICDLMKGLSSQMLNLSYLAFESLEYFEDNISKEIKSLEKNTELKTGIVPYIIYAFGFAIFLLALDFFVLTIQVNQPFNDKPTIIRYMASTTRLAWFLQQDGEAAWEYFRNYMPSSVRSNFFMKNSMETEQASHKDDGISDVDFSDITTLPQSPMLTEKKSFTLSMNEEEDEVSFNTGSEDPIEAAINSVKNSPNLSPLFSLVLAATPWVLYLLVLGIFYFPINTRSKKVMQRAIEVEKLEVHMNASLRLMNTAFLLYQNTTDVNKSEFTEIDKVLMYYDSPISKYYTTIRKYTVSTEVTTNIRTITLNLVDKSPPDDILIKDILPILISFANYSMIDIFDNNVSQIVPFPHSNGICFMIVMTGILFGFICYIFLITKVIMQAMNSLFHFPVDLLKKSNDYIPTTVEIKQNIFPSNAIIITSIPDSDEIYSISENSTIILSQAPTDLICKKMSLEFPIIDGSPDYREHLMPDQRTKKIFRCVSTLIGMLIKTVLVEEDREIAHSQVKTIGTGKNSLTYQLCNYMSPYYAKAFGEEDIRIFNYENPSLLFVRICKNAPIQVIDRLFFQMNTTIQNYTSINFLKSDGGLISFITVKGSTPLVVMLFIRDLLTEMSSISKKYKTDPVHSIYVTSTNELNLVIDDDGEPFLSIHSEFILDQEFIAYHIPKSNLCLSNEFLSLVPSFESRLTPFKVQADLRMKTTVNSKILSFGDALSPEILRYL